MDDATPLALALGSEALIALLYTWAGATLASRVYTPEARRAGIMFSLFWFGIAATGVSSVTLGLLARGHADPRLLDGIDQVSLLFFATALVGFTSYLSFIFRGDHRAEAIIIPVYVGLVLWSMVSAALVPATGYHMQAWRPILERPESSIGPSPGLMAVLLVVPTIGGMGAYATLLRTAPDHETRSRIALVSGALVAWLIGVTVISVPTWGEAAAAQLAGRAIVIASGVLILLAYRPPERLRRWMARDAPIDDATMRDAARRQRLQQLI